MNKNKGIRKKAMDDFFEIEKILNAIDFSEGREKTVWEKIVARLSNKHDFSALSFGEFDNVAGGLSQTMEHYEDSDYPWKNKF